MSGAETVILVAAALALGLAIGATCVAFMALSEMAKLRSRQGGRLRLDGNTLHGRIVFVDGINWEREIARWGLDSNGNMSFDMNSDQTLYTGYVIEGPDDVPEALRTAKGAPHGRLQEEREREEQASRDGIRGRLRQLVKR